MKWWSIGVVSLVLMACNPFGKKTNGEKDSAGDSVLHVGISQASGSHAPESAFVNAADVICGGDTLNLTFSETTQWATVFRNLKNCNIVLTSFTVATDGSAETFVRTNRTSQGFDVFDSAAGQTKLAMGMIRFKDLCSHSGNCDFDEVTASFTYSELVREDLILENNLAVSHVSVEIEKEAAPWCTVRPQFEQNGYSAPELVFSFSNCMMLFAHNQLELVIMKHVMGDEYGIEDLHAAITANTSTFDGSSNFEIRLSIDDLKAIAGTDDIFAALATDFVIATRNQSGKSIKYYVIDNDCDPKQMNPQYPPLGGCETAFGFGGTTFISLGIGNRWGWQIDVPVGADASTPLYAGAGQNNVANAVHVGNLLYKYDGSTLTVTYDLFSAYGLDETHLYAGTSNLATTAPGQFGNQHENLGGVKTDSYTVQIASTTGIKISAHANVCDAN